jgi:hypothetical protein
MNVQRKGRTCTECIHMLSICSQCAELVFVTFYGAQESIPSLEGQNDNVSKYGLCILVFTVCSPDVSLFIKKMWLRSIPWNGGGGTTILFSVVFTLLPPGTTAVFVPYLSSLCS